jgi:ADP-L-glycero-D-manno-heptose 6-epimerase
MYIVTGANGFIGSQMVHYLNSKGITDIICVDPISIAERTQPLYNCKYLSFLHPDQLFDFIEKNAASLKCIFHMGACSDTQEMNISYLRTNNTEFTNHLFSFCTQNNHCTFIYASSGAVYGDGKSGFSDETNPNKLEPLNPYGWSKLNSDIWVLEQSKKPKHWYGLRFFNVYGPNEDHKGNMRSVVHKAFEQIRDHGNLKLFKSLNPNYPDGKQMRDFIYVKDVVEWMWLLYERKNIRPNIYNMGYGRARTWIDLATGVFSSLNKPIQIDWVDMPESLRDKYQYFTEAKMKRLLSQGIPNPIWSLEDGIHDYIHHYLLKV